MKFLCTLLMLFVSAISQARELRLLTWNTFLLPPPLNFTAQVPRTRQMMELLPKLGHDVIFLQETFYDSQRRNLIRALKPTHPHILVPDKGRRLRHFQDSGLLIASKFPLKFLELQIFRDCAKSDCLASKSAMLVEATLPDGRALQFVNTHLQAWNATKIYAIRKKQLLVIKDMLSRHAKSGVPQILVGDLNIDGKISLEYPGALELLEMQSAPLTGELDASNGFSTRGCFKRPGDETGPAEWLDHVWIKDPTHETHITERRVLPIMGQLKGQECPLSDHHAVEAVLKL